AGLSQLIDESGDDTEHQTSDANSLATFSMSVWYLRRTWSVSPRTWPSIWSIESAIRVRAQSMVSDTDGAFFRSRFRMDRATLATCSARCSERPGTREVRICASRTGSG